MEKRTLIIIIVAISLAVIALVLGLALGLTLNKKDDDKEQEIETGVDINGILFESKYLELFLIATSKGLQIRKIKGDGPLFEYPVLEEGKKQSLNNACNCLIYEPNKEYLFAGFNDGTIRVFRFVPSN